MRILIVYVLVIAALALPALADIECNFRGSCLGNETDFGGLNQGNDAHYENTSSTDYGYRICCGTTNATITTQCSGGTDNKVLFRAVNETDAHIELRNESTSEYEDICMGTSAGNLVVATQFDNGSCANYQTCVLTSFQGLDSHVANCTSTAAYNTTVCLSLTFPINNATGTEGSVTIDAGNSTTSSILALGLVDLSASELDNKPDQVNFPNGILNFTITDVPIGGTVTLTMTLPNPAPVGTRWYKVSSSGTWSSTAIGSDDGDNVITLSITDGGSLDADGIANGQITDPGGGGNDFSADVPEFSTWIMIIMALGLVGAGITRLRKK